MHTAHSEQGDGDLHHVEHDLYRHAGTFLLMSCDEVTSRAGHRASMWRVASYRRSQSSHCETARVKVCGGEGIIHSE